MNRAEIGHNRPVSQRLHPFVYKAIVGLALVFVLAVSEFAGDSYAGYLIVVVAGLVFVALALPYVLWRIWRSIKIPTNLARKRHSGIGWTAISKVGRTGSRLETPRSRLCYRSPRSPSAWSLSALSRISRDAARPRRPLHLSRRITGVTEIVWQERVWRFKLSHERWLHAALPMRFSPVLP